jgi:RHS repeat-associated protein
VTKRINYLYAADGRKLKETITDGAMTHTFDYCSNLVYEDGELSYLLTLGGRAIPTEQEGEYVYEYFLKDHLGNVRVVFGDPDLDEVAEVIQENHYYPFGMTMGGLNYVAGLENRYLYQGKEITGDFGLWWQDFHARRFDSQLGRWHVPDPAGQFASPYIGMGNNPIRFSDPDGRHIPGGPWWMDPSIKRAEREVQAMYCRLLGDFSKNQIFNDLLQQDVWNDMQENTSGGEQLEVGNGPDDPPANNQNNSNENQEEKEQKAHDADMKEFYAGEMEKYSKDPLSEGFMNAAGESAQIDHLIPLEIDHQKWGTI